LPCCRLQDGPLWSRLDPRAGRSRAADRAAGRRLSH
jgi:hypothetical protein